MSKGMIRRALFVFVFCAASQAHAAWATNWAVPTSYDVVTAVVPGIMVHGAFGNAAGCSSGDIFFIPKAGNEQQYSLMVATVMMAIATGKEIAAYVTNCSPQNWYAVPTHTFGNVVGTTLNIR